MITEYPKDINVGDHIMARLEFANECHQHRELEVTYVNEWMVQAKDIKTGIGIGFSKGSEIVGEIAKCRR